MKRPGIPPLLKKYFDCMEENYAKTGLLHYGRFSFYYSVGYDFYPKFYVNRNEQLDMSLIDIDTKSSNTNVVLNDGYVVDEGEAVFTVTLRLKTPDEGYVENKISKDYYIYSQ